MHPKDADGMANSVDPDQTAVKREQCRERHLHIWFKQYLFENLHKYITVKILKFGTPQTIALIVLKIEKFDVTLH